MRIKILALIVVFMQVIAATATVIQQTPISLSPKPNIILAYDDSGSMSDSSANIIPDSPSPSNTTQSVLSVWYNPLAYNPNVTYTPWVKTKTSTGVTLYPNAPLSLALTTTTSNGVTTSTSKANYY